ncbi:hypothetical protein NIES4103_65320 [Nostoc sp. NIES-4103]|nr:hypothetical protein NIES4103_65320 [Nostoc sp. NIES-4103]
MSQRREYDSTALGFPCKGDCDLRSVSLLVKAFPQGTTTQSNLAHTKNWVRRVYPLLNPI